LTAREPTFGIFGAIGGVGRYRIPEPNYRLLEALTEAGGVPPTIPYVRVIRQVPLDEQIQSGVPGARGPGAAPARPGQPAQPAQQGTDLRDLIDELTRPEGEGAPNMTALASMVSAQPERQDQTADEQDTPPAPPP